MDPRYKIAPIFNRRKEEWVPDKIKDHIEKLFKNIEAMEGWKFISSSWVNSRIYKEELKKSIFAVLKIKIQGPDQKIYEYDIQVPELVHDQYFYISGYLKTPVFQLYDYPIIYRDHVLKFRNNTVSLYMNDKESNSVNLFNKVIPMSILVSAIYTKEEFDSFANNLTDHESLYLEALKQDCNNIWDSTTERERIESLGKYFSTSSNDLFKKGTNVIFSVKMAYDVDFFNHTFMKTNSIIFELIQALYEGYRSDTNIKNKRIRLAEYILSPLTKKLFDMLVALKSSNKIKFQIPQTILMDFCNRSGDVVRSNMYVNPVSELAGMLHITLTGPGGFKKENVPTKLRNLDDSQFGYICPADTPDRSGCGVTQNLIPTINLDVDGNFAESDKEVVTSYPIALTPFLEHDDQVRLQMASNQCKQAILLRNSETPWIKSGIEDNYLEDTTFLYRAKKDGRVVHLDQNIMIVSYDEKVNDKTNADYFKIGYRNAHQNLVDFLKPMFKENDNFKQDDILCESHFLDNGELSLGQNLLTAVAIWKGFNYEDGIVLSKSAARNKFTSIHSEDLSFTIETSQVLLSLDNDNYQPLPRVGQYIKKGEPYARIKTLDLEEGYETINTEPLELVSPIDCRIINVEIYPNSWNKQVKEFHAYIKNSIDAQAGDYSVIYSKLEDVLGRDGVEKFMIVNNISKLDCRDKQGKYSLKGSKYKGIQFKIQAVYEEQIGVGDKIANRHGNKGVIALIEDDDKMPILPDGRVADVVINPLGIISRMNAGQLFELHLNECFYQVKKKIIKYFNDKDKCREFFKGFLDIIDKTPTKWVTERLLSRYDYIEPISANGEILVENLYLIQPPFESIGPEDLQKAIDYAGSDYSYTIYDPDKKMFIENPVSCGYMYVLKLIHRSSDKMGARSIGPYSKKTLQPLGGKSRQGGHRVGEMEVWALMAHGAHKYFLRDLLTVQADSPGLKNELLAKILNSPVLSDSDQNDKSPQSLRLLNSYLKQLGLELESSE